MIILFFIDMSTSHHRLIDHLPFFTSIFFCLSFLSNWLRMTNERWLDTDRLSMSTSENDENDVKHLNIRMECWKKHLGNRSTSLHSSACLVYEEKMKSSRFIFTIDFCHVTICWKEKFDDDDNRDKRTHERRKKRRISTFVSFNFIRSRKNDEYCVSYVFAQIKCP